MCQVTNLIFFCCPVPFVSIGQVITFGSLYYWYIHIFLSNPHSPFPYVFLSVKYRKSKFSMIQKYLLIIWFNNFLVNLWLLFLTCFISLYFITGGTAHFERSWHESQCTICHLLGMWSRWCKILAGCQCPHLYVRSIMPAWTSPILIVIPPYIKIDNQGNPSSYWIWNSYAFGETIKIQPIIPDNTE